MGLARSYLVLYNLAQAAGWALCLYQISVSLAKSAGSGLPNLRDVYETSIASVRLFQAISLLDVAHAIVGIVPSSPILGLVQWAGRSNVLYLVLCVIEQVQATWPAIIMLLVWSLSEVIRYPWYALTGLGACPAWLTWLRYSAFIPLYPVGVVTEMMILWNALPFIKERGLYSISMPNKFNFGFQYHIFGQIGLLVYVPVWWNLYSSLLRQRKKKLSASSASGDATKKSQ